MPCDILLSPHPGFTGLFEAMEQAQSGGRSDAFIDPDACKNYVGTMREWLTHRIAEEGAE
jgi:metallo-beta-lactamase class B